MVAQNFQLFTYFLIIQYFANFHFCKNQAIIYLYIELKCLFMSFLSYKHGFSPKIELKSKECIDLVLQPLKYHVTIKVNGSLTSEDIFRTVVSMAVDYNSVHSASKQYHDVACETSLRYHLKKLNMEELIKSNEKILLQELIKTLKTGK